MEFKFANKNTTATAAAAARNTHFSILVNIGWPDLNVSIINDSNYISTLQMHGILLYAVQFENCACACACVCQWLRVATLCAKRFIVANNDVSTFYPSKLTIYYFLYETPQSHADNLVRRVTSFFSYLLHI